MRARAWFSNNRHEVFPFRSWTRDETSEFLSPTPVELAVEWYYRVEKFLVTITWHIDPATSLTASTTYTRQIEVTRTLDPTLKEWMLLFPGVYADAVEGDLGLYNVWTWESQVEVEGIDDVFQSTILEASMTLFLDGYFTPATDGTLAEGYIRPSIIFRLMMTYDDGNEGNVYIETEPTSWQLADPPEPGPDFQMAAAGEIDGISFVLVGADDLPSDIYHKAEPEVVITPLHWYAWAKADGTEPVWNTGTGAQILDPRTAGVF